MVASKRYEDAQFMLRTQKTECHPAYERSQHHFVVEEPRLVVMIMRERSERSEMT